jgi:hypothetical protein
MIIRMRPLILLGLLTAAAPAMAESLPVPPIPPESPHLAAAAPLPDFASQAPAAPASKQVSVDMHFYSIGTSDPSMTVASGSRYQWSDNRRPLEPPGVMATVPFE